MEPVFEFINANLSIDGVAQSCKFVDYDYTNEFEVLIVSKRFAQVRSVVHTLPYNVTASFTGLMPKARIILEFSKTPVRSFGGLVKAEFTANIYIWKSNVKLIPFENGVLLLVFTTARGNNYIIPILQRFVVSL